MRYIITVFKDWVKDLESTPIGFGVLESSGEDLEEVAQGDLTILGDTHKAQLSVKDAPAPEETAQQIPLDLKQPLQPAED